MLAATAHPSRPRLDRRAHGGPLVRYFTVLCAAFVFAALWFDLTASPIVMKLGSYNLAIAEPLILFSSLCILFSLNAGGILRVAPLFVVALGMTASLLIPLARGLTGDSMAALFEARPLLCTALLPVLGVLIADRPELLRRAVSAVKFAAGALTLLVVSRTLFHVPSNEFYATDGRALLQYGSLVLAAAAVLCVSDGIRLKTPGYEIYMGAIFLLACLLTRQATSSLAALAGLAIMMFMERGRAVGARRLAIVAIIALIATAFIFSDDLSSSADSSGHLAQYLNDRASTNLTRHLIWDSFMENYLGRNPFDMTFGVPLGVHEKIYIRAWGGIYWKQALHSMYYETLQHEGAMGLMSYLLVLLFSLIGIGQRWLRGLRSQGAVSYPAAIGLIAVMIIFGHSYDLYNQASFFLMMIVAVAASSETTAPQNAPRAMPRTTLAVTGMR